MLLSLILFKNYFGEVLLKLIVAAKWLEGLGGLYDTWLRGRLKHSKRPKKASRTATSPSTTAGGGGGGNVKKKKKEGKKRQANRIELFTHMWGK